MYDNNEKKQISHLCVSVLIDSISSQTYRFSLSLSFVDSPVIFIYLFEFRQSIIPFFFSTITFVAFGKLFVYFGQDLIISI